MTSHPRALRVSTAAELRARSSGAVYVNPCYLHLARELLQGAGIPVGSTVGFPFGCTTTEVKLYELEQVVEIGAESIGESGGVGLVEGLDVLKETGAGSRSGSR